LAGGKYKENVRDSAGFLDFDDFMETEKAMLDFTPSPTLPARGRVLHRATGKPSAQKTR
jgi:hypothetical protein